VENINQIFLIGMMGSGKSSVGKALADSLNWTFYDIDHELEKDHNLSINDMFAHGEAQFRDHESKKLQEIASKENIVCSTGGGVVLNESNCDILGELFCVYLHASIESLCHRLENDSSRPLLSNGDKKKLLENIFLDRESKYEALSSMKIITDTSSIDEICQTIKEHI
tara:strand:+ start:8380 stop:8883 length:504 start_codon:yes stop_codon:yes gene_type:complete